MHCLEIRHLYKSFPQAGASPLSVLKDINLSIEPQSFTVIVGESGCGKTTLLRLIAQLETPTTGSIQFFPARPLIGFVFQEPRLMPWLTVRENIAFLQKPAQPKRIDTLLSLLELSAFADYYPHQLSGGMAHKVSLGRALAYDPPLILMDEPFASLDTLTRHAYQTGLKTLLAPLDKTIIFVTHNLDEAIALGDTIVILHQGTIADILTNASALKNQADYQESVKTKILQKMASTKPKNKV